MVRFRRERKDSVRGSIVRIHYIAVDNSNHRIVNVGCCHDQATYDVQQVPENCSLHQFEGGVIGHYFFNGEMTETPPI